MDIIDLSTPDRIFTYNGKQYHRPEIIPDGGKILVTFEEKSDLIKDVENETIN